MVDSVTEIRFYLQLSTEQYKRYYQGAAKTIIVTAEDGRRLQFPAAAMQKFLTHDGISGTFVLRFDANHKLLGVDRA